MTMRCGKWIGMAVGIVIACQACSTRSASVSVPEKREWRLVGPGTGGAMFTIAMHPTDPKTIYSGVDMGALFKTTDGGKLWKILGGGSPENPNPAPLGAFGAAVDQVNPDNIWSASGAVYKSENAGETWKVTTDVDGMRQNYFETVTIDPADGNVVYAVSHHQYQPDGVVARTTDGGKTWEEVSKWDRQKEPRHWWGLVIDPNSPVEQGKGHRRLYLFGAEGLFRSEDAGKTWGELGGLPGTAIRNVVLMPSADIPGGSRIGVMATPTWVDEKKKTLEGGIYRSDDDGKTWVKKDQGILFSSGLAGHAERYLLANSKAAPRILYFASEFASVYRSPDAGETWEKIGNHKSEWVVKKTPVEERDYFFLKQEGGSWIDHYFLPVQGSNCAIAHHSSGGAIVGLAVSPADSNVILFTHNSWIVGTFDGGKTWTELCADVGEPFAKDRWADPKYLACDQTHLIKNRGVHLIVPRQVAFDPFDPNRSMAFAYMDLGLRISRDGGEWWEWGYDKDSMIRADSGSANAVTYDPAVRGRLYLGTGTWSVGDVFRSDDGGRHFSRLNLKHAWEKVKQIQRETGNLLRIVVSRIVVDPSSPPERRRLFAGLRIGSYGGKTPMGGLYRSDDDGANWSECSEGLGAAPNIYELLLDEKQPETLYAGVYNDAGPTGLFKTTDGGKAWTNVAADKLGSIRENCLALCREKPDTLYAVAYEPGKAGFWNDAVLWRTDDGGVTWREIRRGFISSVAVNPRDPEWIYITIPTSFLSKRKAGGVLRSRDGGKTWERIDDGVVVEGASRSRIEVDKCDPRRLIHYSLYGVWIGFDPEAPGK